MTQLVPYSAPRPDMARTPFPENAAIAIVQSNSLYPRLNNASTAAFGGAVMEAIAEQELSWDEVAGAFPSADQAHRMGLATNAQHEFMGIRARYDPSRPQGTTPEQMAAGEPVLLPLGAFRGLMIGRRDEFITASANFLNADRLYSDQTWDRVVATVLRQSVHAEPQSELDLLRTARPQELQAMSVVWGAVSRLLQRPDMVADSRRYRQEIADAYHLPIGGMDAATITATDKAVQLRRAMIEAIRAESGTISRITGRRLAMPTIRSFVESMQL